MSAEGQARQLLLIASDPGPGNISPLSGISTVTDFRAISDSVRPEIGASTATIRSASGSILRNMAGLPQAAINGVASMTLRMNPEGFQLAWAGCATPLLLVQRTISVSLPFAGNVNAASHCRKLYFPSSLPSWAACQVLPPSLDRSARATPVLPPKAMPRTSVGAPACTVAPDLMFVMKERGTIRLIGTILTPVSPGLMSA